MFKQREQEQNIMCGVWISYVYEFTKQMTSDTLQILTSFMKSK